MHNNTYGAFAMHTLMESIMQDVFKVTVKKAVTTHDIEFAALPEASQNYLIDYGLKQCLNDCVANPELTQDEAKTKSDKKVAALLDGSVRISTSGRTTDPIGKAAMEYGRELVKKAIEGKGLKVADYTAAQVSGLAAQLIARDDMVERVAAEAKRRVESTATIDIDLGLDVPEAEAKPKKGKGKRAK